MARGTAFGLIWYGWKITFIKVDLLNYFSCPSKLRTNMKVKLPPLLCPPLKCLLFVGCLLSAHLLFAQAPFVTTWKTDNSGWTNGNQIRIPGTGLNYTISWEEAGNPENKGIKKGFGITTVTFPSPGTYIVSISPGEGTFTRIFFDNKYDNNKILSVNQWGEIPWSSMENAFYGCENMDCIATDLPDLSNVTSLRSMFRSCKKLKGPANIGEWNTQNVIFMSSIFAGAAAFNQDISNWDMQSVTDMYGMFNGAKSFNQDISKWNVSKVVDMSHMFWNAISFNQNIGTWNTQNVLYMSYMFANTDNFNQDISAWNVASVYSMDGMFGGASSFNQDIGKWKLRPYVSLRSLFDYSGMDCTNYTATLMGWSDNPATPDGCMLDAIGLEYGNDGIEFRNYLTLNKGWSITGDTLVNVDCLKPSAINSPDSTTRIGLWPNPATDYLHLELPFEDALTVYDLTGRRLLEMIVAAGESLVSLQQFMPGMYILHFEQCGRHLVVVE